MPWQSHPDIWGLLGALIISIISGFISIAQRISKGHTISLIWVSSEFAAALLAGYLMYDAYPRIAETLPSWCTLPIMVALASHVGGRAFQVLEGFIFRRYNLGTQDDELQAKPE